MTCLQLFTELKLRHCHSKWTVLDKDCKEYEKKKGKSKRRVKRTWRKNNVCCREQMTVADNKFLLDLRSSWTFNAILLLDNDLSVPPLRVPPPPSISPSQTITHTSRTLVYDRLPCLQIDLLSVTRRVYPSYYSCGPCACKTGKPVLIVFSLIFQWLIYKTHDCKLCILQLFFIAFKVTVLWMKSLVTRVLFEFTPVFFLSRKLPGTGSAAVFKFRGHWKGWSVQ